MAGAGERVAGEPGCRKNAVHDAALAPGVSRVDTIDEVLVRMDEIDARLPPADGVAVFNRMYRHVTRLVDGAVDRQLFTAGPFLERLDVHFAQLFFDAVEADEAGRPIPRAWRPLFEDRAKPDTHPLQFALAGMNAHISHDLAFAVITTCRERGCDPLDDAPEHHDYTLVNTVLDVGYGEVKTWFSTGVVAEVDELAGTVDDVLSRWGIVSARAGAWEAAQRLWWLGDRPRLYAAASSAHARAVELTSRALLI